MQMLFHLIMPHRSLKISSFLSILFFFFLSLCLGFCVFCFFFFLSAWVFSITFSFSSLIHATISSMLLLNPLMYSSVQFQLLPLFSTSLLELLPCSPILLLRSGIIFMTITLNSLLGRLFTSISLRFFSGDLSCSLDWNTFFCLLIFPISLCLCVLGEMTTSLSLGVALCSGCSL